MISFAAPELSKAVLPLCSTSLGFLRDLAAAVVPLTSLRDLHHLPQRLQPAVFDQLRNDHLRVTERHSLLFVRYMAADPDVQFRVGQAAGETRWNPEACSPRGMDPPLLGRFSRAPRCFYEV